MNCILQLMVSALCPLVAPRLLKFKEPDGDNEVDNSFHFIVHLISSKNFCEFLFTQVLDCRPIQCAIFVISDKFYGEYEFSLFKSRLLFSQVMITSDGKILLKSIVQTYSQNSFKNYFVQFRIVLPNTFKNIFLEYISE